MDNQTSIKSRRRNSGSDSDSDSDSLIEDSTESASATPIARGSAESTGSARNVSGPSAPTDESPNVRTQRETKTSFFDTFRSQKEIERNRKHEQVLEAIKAYASINQQLKELNKNLENWIQLLTVATGGGSKSLLSAATDEAKALMVRHHALISSLRRYPANAHVSVNEVTAYAASRGKVVDKYKIVTELAQNSFNRSSEVEKQLEEAKLQWETLSQVDSAIRVKHRQLATAIQASSNIIVDGAGSDSDTEVDDSDD
jgi:hypothetical protein